MENEKDLIVHIPDDEGYGEKPGFDASLPADVRYDSNLSPMAKLMYCEIRALSSKHGFCYAKNKYFEKVFELTDRAIRLLLQQLKENGYIEIFKATNDVNGKKYRIIMIAGSKIKKVEKPEESIKKKRKKISAKTGKKFPQKPEKNFRQEINKYIDNNIYNTARTRVTENKEQVKKKNQNKFHNFSQREYDFAVLEQALFDQAYKPRDGDDSS